MLAMAKTKKTKTSEPVVDEPETVWKLFSRIDIALKQPFEEYIESREYPPDQARVIERALREFLQKEGFWPPKQK